jgi:hypothetical protein
MNSMRGHNNKDDLLTRLAKFDERVERLGDNVGLFLVVAKDGNVRALPKVHEIKSLIEVEGWRPLGLFSLSPGEMSNEPNGEQTEAETEGIHIERYLYEEPPTTEDAALFDKAIAETIEEITEDAE